MKPLFIAQGNAVPARTLCVDGLIPGSAAVYSHWAGADSPSEIAHDLSTGILLRAAQDPQRYFSGFDFVANNHVDVDGILSMAIALDPSLVQHAGLLLSAAAYGDFNHFKDEAGARLALYLHQEMRRLKDRYGDAWEHEACKVLSTGMDTALWLSQEPNRERDMQIQLIRARNAEIDAGQICISGDADLHVICAPYELGHKANDLCSVFVEDDLPLWSLNARIPRSAFQLLCLQTDAGYVMQLNAPTYSWAQTVDLPPVAWPNLEAAVLELQKAERNAVRWIGLPHSKNYDFTCILAAIQAPQAGAVDAALSLAPKLAPSTLQPEQAAAILRTYL